MEYPHCSPVSPVILKGRATNEDDHDLATNHDKIHAKEEPVLKHAFKNVKFVVKPAITA